MRRNRRINPDHQAQRGGLRFLGVFLVLAGGTLAAIGFVSFFSTFGNLGSGPPRYFWCAFIGLPMLGIGVKLLKMGYLGTITRYVAGEAAPVATDTFKYVVDETEESVRKVASAVSSGMRGEGASTASARCRGCGHANDADARFCDQCGNPMPKPNVCRECRETNDDDARFCNGCGASLG